METCFCCGKELNNLNTPIFGVGKTKDNKTSCTSCHRKISTKLHKTKLSNDNSENILNELNNFENTEKVTFKERVKQNLPNEILNKSINEDEPKKWYDNTLLLIFLFFFFAPLGIYGVFKRKNTVLWKKLVFTLFGLGYLLFIIPMIIAGIYVANLDNYSEGNDYYRKEDYTTAIDYYSKVKKDDKNYNLAQQKIKEINAKLSQIEMQKKQEREVQLSKLIDYQKVWADSIVKSESQPGNRHFVGSKVIAPDSIVFEYTEGITKNGFKENFNIDTLVYKQQYQKSISHKFGKEYEDVKTVISFIPNKNVDFKKVIEDKNTKAERQQKIQMMFSAWDGSHSELKRLVKSNMNDPSSFDHVETSYSDKGSYILVQMKFRGNNSFGAKVLNSVTAKVDLEGNVLSVR